MKHFAAFGLSAALLAGVGIAGAGATATGHSQSDASIGAFSMPTDDNTPENYFYEEEIALAQLDPTGLPIDTYVVSRVSSRGGPERTVLNPFTTTNVEYLNQRGRPTVKSTGIEVSVGGSEPNNTLVRGLMDKSLPIAIHAEYKLNGKIVDPNLVMGESGVLDIKYSVTNVDVKTKKLKYTDASGKQFSEKTPVFAPMVGNLVAKVPGNWEPTDVSTGLTSTDANGDTLVTWNLLVYPPMGDFTQELKMKANIENGEIPGVVLTMMPATTTQDPATGFSKELLTTSVEGNEQLEEGLNQLNTQTLALATGAAQLASGIGELSSGAEQGNALVKDELLPGSELVAEGAAGVALGQEVLTDSIDLAVVVASDLSDGASQLEVGLQDLARLLTTSAKDGLPLIRDIAQQIEEDTNQLADQVGSADNKPLPLPPTREVPKNATLYQVVDVATRGTALLAADLADLAAALAPLVSDIQGSGTDATSAANDAELSVTGLQDLQAQICKAGAIVVTQAQCDQLAKAIMEAASASTTGTKVAANLAKTATALNTEQLKATAAELSAKGLVASLDQARDRVAEVSKALRSGSIKPGQMGIAEALDVLVASLDSAIKAAQALSAGAQQASNASIKLAEGIAELSSGLATMENGAAELASISKLVAEGAILAAFGTGEVAAALALLTDGLQKSATASTDLADGASLLQSEGTQELLETVITSSAQPAQAVAYLDAANKRAATALPYSPPEGATGSAAYIMTMSAVAPENTSSWLIVALLIVLVSALGGAVVKRIRSQNID
jgi:X-X-X-Leu-X-X-Gly heptad repeat protein